MSFTLPPAHPLTVPAPYLEGLLAAVRPGEQKATAPSQAETPPAPEETASALPEENLSPEERIKRHLHPLDSFVRLLDCSAANRPPDPDDRFRFQWFGLFYQAPEQDAFILRLRLPGGRIKPCQFAGLASITQRCAGGEVVFNSQGALDIPGVPITSAAEILTQVESIGLSALRTGGDCVQAIRGGELDCLPADGRDDNATVYPLVRALEHALAYSPTFADLPLPCEIVFVEADESCVVRPARAIDTISLQVLANTHWRPEPAPTRDTCVLLHVPGKADFLLPLPKVVSACLTLLKSWAAGAERSSRATASLATFLHGLGSQEIGTLLGGVERAPLAAGSQTKPPPVDNKSVPGVNAPGGRLLSGQLMALARCSQEQRWPEIRLRRNHLFAVGADGNLADGSAVLGEALAF